MIREGDFTKVVIFYTLYALKTFLRHPFGRNANVSPVKQRQTALPL